MKKKKRAVLLIFFILPLLFVFVANYSIKRNAQNKTFSNASVIAKNKVGLVLGTSKLLINGRINLYFQYRIDATVALYKAGKIDFVLVSGDNGNELYDTSPQILKKN